MRGLLLTALSLALFSGGFSRPRSNRDWAKMSDKDWDAIEKEWETPEEKEEYEYKPPKQKGIDMEKLQKVKDPKKVQEMVAESQVSSGPAMMFASLDYPGCCVKKETERIATEWASLLRAGGMDISTYVIEDDQVLFSTQAGFHAKEIQEYVLKQKECVSVTWNSNTVEGPAMSPEWKAKDDAKKAAKKAEKEKKDLEKAAAEKAKKKRKKRKKKGKEESKEEL